MGRTDEFVRQFIIKSQHKNTHIKMGEYYTTGPVRHVPSPCHPFTYGSGTYGDGRSSSPSKVSAVRAHFYDALLAH